MAFKQFPLFEHQFVGGPTPQQFPSNGIQQRNFLQRKKIPTETVTAVFRDLRLDTHSRTKDISKLETTYKRTFPRLVGDIIAGSRKVPPPLYEGLRKTVGFP